MPVVVPAVVRKVQQGTALSHQNLAESVERLMEGSGSPGR